MPRAYCSWISHSDAGNADDEAQRGRPDGEPPCERFHMSTPHRSPEQRMASMIELATNRPFLPPPRTNLNGQ